MTGGLAEALAAERRAFDEANQKIGMGLISFVMSDAAATGWNSVPIPTLSVPADYAGLLLTRNFDEEVLAKAAAAAVQVLRPAGQTVVLGGSLSVLADLLRMRIAPEERLQMAVEAARCFATPDTMRLHGRCLTSIGTILRDIDLPYDAMAAYDKAAAVLVAFDDVAGLTAIAYHRTVIARSARLYEEGLLSTEPFADLKGAEDVTGFDGIVSERAICRLESGDLAGAASEVDDWIAQSGKDEGIPAFNRVLPYSMRGRVRVWQGDIDGAIDDVALAAEFGVQAVRQAASRTFRTSNRAQLDPVFQELLRLAVAEDRAELAVGALLAEKTVTPGLFRPALSGGEDEPFATSVSRELAADTAALVGPATSATILGDLAAMQELSDRSLELVDLADVLAERQDGKPVPLDLKGAAARMQAWLQPDELIVEYAHVHGTTWALVIQPQGCSCHVVLAEEALVLLLGLCTQQEFAARETPQALDRLGRLLLDPVLEFLRSVRRMYVVLPPSIPAFPLHAVEVDGSPLVQHVEVVYLPSTEFLDPRLARSGINAEACVMAVAEPRYEVFPPLMNALAEARAAAARLGTANVLVGDAATASALLDALTRGGLLHVTAHAAFEPSAPLLARLLLADRPVFAFEIAFARSAAIAVNLSGCSTASQSLRIGGQGEGLAAAFLSAGVPAVVASWWPIEDLMATAFNAALYADLAATDPPDVFASVNRAQRALLESPGVLHPASWAPFVVLGTPTRERG